jgi:hypothetical protein
MIVLCLLVIPACWGPPGSGGNEGAAIANLRTINTAEVTFLSSSGRYGSIPELIAAGLLDSRFNSTVSGYNFYIVVSEKSYEAAAIPVSSNTGRFGYYSNPDGIVRYAPVTTLAPAGMEGAPVK